VAAPTARTPNAAAAATPSAGRVAAAITTTSAVDGADGGVSDRAPVAR
jgi:hypothetical protein